MNIRNHFLRLAAIAAVAALAAQPAHADSIRSAIEASNAKFVAAVAKGDGAAIAALYAPDGKVLPPNGEAVSGAKAIEKHWQGALDAGVAAITLKTVEVHSGGKTATEVGEYDLKDKAGKHLDHGKYIVVWREAGGKWQLLRDMYSSNMAPAKP